MNNVYIMRQKHGWLYPIRSKNWFGDDAKIRVFQALGEQYHYKYLVRK